MKHRLVIPFLTLFFFLTGCAETRYEKDAWVMEAPMKLIIYAPFSLLSPSWDEITGFAIDEAVLYDHRLPESPLARLNQTGSLAVPVPLYNTLKEAVGIARMSGGAFDPTIFPLMRLWAFEQGGRLPAPAEIDQAKKTVGYENIELGPGGRVTLRNHARLDLGGIGQGAVVDAVSSRLDEKGYKNYLVDASGDILVSGLKPGNLSWTIVIRSPRKEGMPVTSPDFQSAALGFIGKIEIGTAGAKRAVVTSGDYENRFLVNGVSYHHILDPATGYPARGACSVTVIASTCTQADALATTSFILGYERGLRFLEDLPEVEGLLIREVDGKLEMHATSGFPKIMPLAD